VERVVGCADTVVVFAHRDPGTPRAGRTTTLLDDWLTRAVGPLPINAALVLAGAVYGGLGLALPLLVHAHVPLLIGCNVMGASLGWAITLAWIFPASEARLRRQLLEQTSNLRLLSAAEFELLVAELLRREGWYVDVTGRHGDADGNVDLRIRRGERQMLVQCKQWQSWQIGVDEIRKLAGTLLREGLPGTSGMLATTSTFTPDAIAEAKQTGIELVGGDELVRRLHDAGATQLLAGTDEIRAAYPCPNCATPMILAQSQYGWWLRCPNHDAGCKGKRDLGTDPRRALELLLTSP
jgi:restriction system protein